MIPFDGYDYIFYTVGLTLACFGWVVVAIYYTMAFKGLTIIEAADRFKGRFAQVLSF